MNINATLIGQMLSFVVFVWFTMKYVWTPIMGALDARRKEIADGLATAERGRTEQKLAQERAAEYLKDAKAQGAEVIGQAQKRAGEIQEIRIRDALVDGLPKGGQFQVCVTGKVLGDSGGGHTAGEGWCLVGSVHMSSSSRLRIHHAGGRADFGAPV